MDARSCAEQFTVLLPCLDAGTCCLARRRPLPCAWKLFYLSSSSRYFFPLRTNLNQSDYCLTPWLPELWHEHSSSQCPYHSFYGFFFLPVELGMWIFEQKPIGAGPLSTPLENNSLKEVSVVWGGISVKEEVGIRRPVLEEQPGRKGTWLLSMTRRRVILKAEESLKHWRILGWVWLFLFVPGKRSCFYVARWRSVAVLKVWVFRMRAFPFLCFFSSHVLDKFQVSYVWQQWMGASSTS